MIRVLCVVVALVSFCGCRMSAGERQYYEERRFLLESRRNAVKPEDNFYLEIGLQHKRLKERFFRFQGGAIPAKWARILRKK